MPKGWYDVDELLNSIKIRCAVPISQITFQDQDLLTFADEETKLKIVPQVLKVRQEYYGTTVEIPLVPNQSAYEIPYRAIGNKVRHVFYRQSVGYLLPLAFIPIENINQYQTNNFPFQFAGFYLEGNNIIMVPPVSTNPVGDLELRYYFSPNTLAMMDTAAQIQAIDFTTGVITVDQVPANLAVGTEIDFINYNPTHATAAFDVPIIAASSMANTITVNPADLFTPVDTVNPIAFPLNINVGDYICTAGQTVIPQVPPDLHIMLAQAVACRVLESLGDQQGLQAANQKLADMQYELLGLISNRIEGPPRKAVNINSTLSKGRIFRRGAF